MMGSPLDGCKKNNQTLLTKLDPFGNFNIRYTDLISDQNKKQQQILLLILNLPW